MNFQNILTPKMIVARFLSQKVGRLEPFLSLKVRFREDNARKTRWTKRIG